MRNKIILGVAISCASVLFATPPYMWVGTAAITDYALNGGTQVFNNAQVWGDKFFQGASFYSNYNGVTGQPIPYRSMDLQNTGVTWSALNSGSSRINADHLLIITGSCIPSGIKQSWLGNNSGYGNLIWKDGHLPLGTVNNRWIIWPEDNIMDGMTYTNIDPTFRGLQTAMGFRVTSNVTNWYTDNFVPEAFSGAYWSQWAYFGLTHWNAYKNAVNYAADHAGVTSISRMYSSYHPSTYNYFYNETYSSNTAAAAVNEAWTWLEHSNM